MKYLSNSFKETLQTLKEKTTIQWIELLAMKYIVLKTYKHYAKICLGMSLKFIQYLNEYNEGMYLLTLN